MAEEKAELLVTTETTEVALKNHFEQFREQAAEWKEKAFSIVVTDITQKEIIAKSEEGYKIISKVITGIEKTRKDLKEDSLRTGRLIDSIARTMSDEILPIKEHLKAQKDFVENEEKKIYLALKAERVAALQPYTDQDATTLPLADMPQMQFEMMLKGYKEVFQQQQEDKRIAEEQRAIRAKAEAEELERTRADNERLRKENEERDRIRLEEKKALEAAQKIERDEAAAKLKAEREAREKLEREASEREDKEEAERKARAAADRKMKRAPDKTKLLDLAARLGAVILPSVKDDDAQKIVNNAEELIKKTVKYITDNAEKL